MKELVKIKHWRQYTMESGGWVFTEAMKKEKADKLIEAHIYEDAEIVNAN